MRKKAWTAAEMGRKGGSAKVKKGIATLSKKAQRELGKRAALARWGSNSVENEASFGRLTDTAK